MSFLLGQERTMLVGRRKLLIGEKTFKTPILIPSFSSRGFENVAKILNSYGEFLETTTLVSAYDIAHHKVKQKQVKFIDYVFIDSGGYEKGDLPDLSEVPKDKASKKDWDVRIYHKTLKNNWDFTKTPTVIVTYDNPASLSKQSFAKQISRCESLMQKFENATVNFLIKPSPDLSGELKGYFDVQKLVHVLKELPDIGVLGITEKELGRTLIERMTAIALVRKELNRLDRNIPIHVFGSLDPISTSLFFISGADIFDGLTWLRYGYEKGNAFYLHNLAARKGFHNLTEESLRLKIAISNLAELDNLQVQLETYAHSHDVATFADNEDIILKAIDLLKANIGEL